MRATVKVWFSLLHLNNVKFEEVKLSSNSQERTRFNVQFYFYSATQQAWDWQTYKNESFSHLSTVAKKSILKEGLDIESVVKELSLIISFYFNFSTTLQPKFTKLMSQLWLHGFKIDNSLEVLRIYSQLVLFFCEFICFDFIFCVFIHLIFIFWFVWPLCCCDYLRKLNKIWFFKKKEEEEEKQRC